MESAVSTRRELDDSRTSCLERQNTADRAKIPGNDGGRPQKVGADGASLDPATQAEQSAVCPPAQSGRIRRARRIFAVRRCLLHGIAGGDAPTCLLSTTHAE